jgi:hypothetical protein
MSETWLDSSRPFKFGELVTFKVYRSIAVTVVRRMQTVLRQMRWRAAGHEHSLLAGGTQLQGNQVRSVMVNAFAYM